MVGLHLATWKTAFWIASVLGIILLAVYMLASNQVTYYNSDDLGLLTKLPITYWIGLFYLFVLLFLGRNSRPQIIIVVVLISFYLFGIPTLIMENKADPTSYFWSSMGQRLASQGSMNFSALSGLDLRNWPGYFFVTAFLTSLTGLPANVFASYFPLLIIALLGILTYSILRLRLSSLNSSLGALWVIGSLWTGQQYFMPQSIALLLYFTIFLLVAKLFFDGKQRCAEISLTIILLFTALVTTHLLTSFFVLVAIIAVYVSSKISFRKNKLLPFFSFATCFLLASISMAYNFLIIQQSSSQIVEILYTQLTQLETPLSSVGLTVSGTRALGSINLQLQVASSYFITLSNLFIAAIAILTVVVGLLFHKNYHKLYSFWIAWIVSAGLLGLSVVYGPEALIRAFMFALLPISYFAIKFLGKRRVFLILILAMIVFVNIQAQYSQKNFTYMPSTELRGTAFYTKYAPGNESFFYEYLAPIGGLGTGAQLNLPSYNYLPSSEIVNETVGKAKFVISSNMQDNYYRYFYGVNPISNLSLGVNFSQLYDSGYFKIYAR